MTFLPYSNGGWLYRERTTSPASSPEFVNGTSGDRKTIVPSQILMALISSPY